MSSSIAFLLQGFARAVTELVDFDEAIARVRKLHAPIAGDEYVKQRCQACIAGYDPQTGLLVHAAWPCSTLATLDDKE